MSAGPAPAAERPAPTARLVALLSFAAAMGWLEGVVVVYIRGLLGAPHGPLALAPGDVMLRFGRIPWLLPTEQTREAATLVMLAAVAWLSARHARGRFGALLVIFGVWDIAYYAALYALLGWPPSLATMDVLFLIPPGPWWHQPVWVPLLIASAMVATGLKLWREGTRSSA